MRYEQINLRICSDLFLTLISPSFYLLPFISSKNPRGFQVLAPCIEHTHFPTPSSIAKPRIIIHFHSHHIRFLSTNTLTPHFPPHFLYNKPIRSSLLPTLAIQFSVSRSQLLIFSLFSFLCLGQEVNMGSIGINSGNGFHVNDTVAKEGQKNSCWYEEEIDNDLRWSFAIRRVLYTGSTKYQDIQLLDTKPFGKALIIDGKLQSTEKDEFIYHESLVHPALLHHPNPKSVFIMGGGEGSTAREIMRHMTIEKVVMCDIDKDVVDFCKTYLDVNHPAFHDPRLELIINDARIELQDRKEDFDVIIGDLADPLDGGPCYQLYTKSFYEFIVKPRLSDSGIFITQAGPAGIFSHGDVFSCIYNTLKQVFKYVVPYSAHVPSFADTWGWVMASDSPLVLSPEEFDLQAKQRIKGENRFLDGKTFLSASTLSRAVRDTLDNETEVYTEATAKFIYGHGSAYRLNQA